MRNNRYVAYFRVSTQKHAASEFLAQHRGTVVSEFIEVESGNRPDRPEFTKAAHYAELACVFYLNNEIDFQF